MRKQIRTGIGRRRKACRAGILMLGLAALMMSGCQSKKYEKINLETEPARETGMPSVQKAENPVASVGVSGVIVQGQTGESKEGGAGQAQPETLPELESREETVYISAQEVNVRQSPSEGAAVIDRLNTGDELRRTGYSDSWSRVIYQEKECYVASRYLATVRPEAPETSAADASADTAQSGEVALNPDWKYAGFAKITSGKAVLYRSEAAGRKGKVVCINAGHGTSGGSGVKTQCHPDGTPKVTGGTTGAGAISAAAVSGGMQFADGTAEAKVTLAMAKVLKEKLLARGFDVLMIRESDDVQLDNIARTVIANNMADCHIALHWDSTSSNKGAFYMSVPNVSSYRSMEPVASHWQEHHALGDSLIAGLKGADVKIFSNGKMEMDLTQTSYSTVPSVDIELGDKASDHSAAALDQLGSGLADGVELFFGN